MWIRGFDVNVYSLRFTPPRQATPTEGMLKRKEKLPMDFPERSQYLRRKNIYRNCVTAEASQAQAHAVCRCCTLPPHEEDYRSECGMEMSITGKANTRFQFSTLSQRISRNSQFRSCSWSTIGSTSLGEGLYQNEVQIGCSEGHASEF